MLQINSFEPTLIQFNKRSLFPSQVKKNIASGVIVEMVKTVGNVSKTTDIRDVNFNECSGLYSFLFKPTTPIKVGAEFTINIYIDINGETFKYTNLANIL